MLKEFKITLFTTDRVRMHLSDHDTTKLCTASIEESRDTNTIQNPFNKVMQVLYPKGTKD